MDPLKGTLWKAADKLRGSLSASQYKDVVLGLVFLQYAADGHWKSLADKAKSPDIGQLIDAAMGAVMAGDPALSGTLPQRYHTLDQRRLGELVELLADTRITRRVDHPARDLMGEVYEYFLGNFARAEGRRGGEFFTPPSIVRLMVEVLEPTSGRVYDPCCGSGGMFVQTDKFLRCQDGDIRDVAIYGQESVEETWRMARINLAIHGIDNTGIVRGDTFVADLHDGLQMDYVMANPPFNIKDWSRDEHDPRWRYGVPPATNANFAWIQHILQKLAPGGQAGVVMTNGSMSSTAGGEGAIRARIVDADLVSCLVALPTQLFRSTGIPVCLWFFARDKGHRGGQVLFIDARSFGYLVDRAERALTDEEIGRIGNTYHAWRTKHSEYQDIPGFCKSTTLDQIRAAGYVLTPGRYVDAPTPKSDAEPLDNKIARLTTELLTALDESARLDDVVRKEVERLRWR
ncbi:restriction endonuclease subunit M [Mycobacterium intermedium]|uniref:site-specific DNA-methyltransferase (adenine-specific) n=1 Tax=Mycobacterium intermedium TaxID=28445 RepID=A0A1E3SCZ7_MYCIE|nr:type I restriction-modification system subunit M [Mycobacterium intermedium]MCV6965859.1 N-6 DNA methylase [Mycobacterium intermedium]ODQ99447.1 restriction endonuclease subunit M [Mycobacterium intermedium]OPE50783.1 restriction endonuclease subunit M [Mycobacterium intermedium]ORB10060.1 restriction endonuclease subunit M [Mycobacterium intermedium]